MGWSSPTPHPTPTPTPIHFFSWDSPVMDIIWLLITTVTSQCHIDLTMLISTCCGTLHQPHYSCRSNCQSKRLVEISMGILIGFACFSWISHLTIACIICMCLLAWLERNEDVRLLNAEDNIMHMIESPTFLVICFKMIRNHVCHMCW